MAEQGVGNIRGGLVTTLIVVLLASAAVALLSREFQFAGALGFVAAGFTYFRLRETRRVEDGSPIGKDEESPQTRT